MREPVEISVVRDIAVPMRDDVKLYADVYRPAAGGPVPVLLLRTPYNKEDGANGLIDTNTFRAVRRGGNIDEGIDRRTAERRSRSEPSDS